MLKTLLSLSSCLLHILHIFHSFSHPPLYLALFFFCLCLTESLIRNLCTCQEIPWHQQYEAQALERRKARSSLFLGTNNEAAHPRMVVCELRFCVNGCYRCSFIRVVIDFVFNKERELNRAWPNTAVLMLINVGNRDQRKIQGPLGEAKTEKREKQMWVRPHFCFQLITLSVHWQEKWSAEEKKQRLLNVLSWQLSLLSWIVLSQHSQGVACKS